MPDSARDPLSHPEAAERAMQAGRRLGAAAVLFHHAVAGHMGLTLIEEKSLDFVIRLGPLTAGELAGHTGLAPSSVTALIDRLERKGFVTRQPDPDDARRVRVAAVSERQAEFYPLFTRFVADLDLLNARYSAAELSVIADFLDRAAEVQQAAAAALSAPEGTGPAS